MLSISHFVLIIVIILIFFGPKKLPDLMKSFGESIVLFKKTLADGEKKLEDKADKLINPIAKRMKKVSAEKKIPSIGKKKKEKTLLVEKVSKEVVIAPKKKFNKLIKTSKIPKNKK
jgi:sec-independent protein translocase protein TatA